MEISLKQAKELLEKLERAIEEAQDHQLSCPVSLPEEDLFIFVNPHIKSSREIFLEHLKHASEIVGTWPEWKQNLLGSIS